MRKLWLPELDERLIAAFHRDTRTRVIAREMDMTEYAVKERLRKLRQQGRVTTIANQTLAQKLAARSRKQDATGCVEWVRSKTRGYGNIRVGGKVIYAHRAAYELKYGTIPEGLEIDHLCRNPACINPNHLEAVSHRENGLRGTSPAALNYKKTHCDKGHALIASNLRKTRGGRQCKICHRERNRNSSLRLRYLSVAA